MFWVATNKQFTQFTKKKEKSPFSKKLLLKVAKEFLGFER